MTWWLPQERASNAGRCWPPVCRSAGSGPPRRSPRPWCFSPATTVATSRARKCLWMAAWHKCRPCSAAGHGLNHGSPALHGLVPSVWNVPESMCWTKGSVLCGDCNSSRTANRQMSSNSTRSPSRRWARRRCFIAMEAAPLNPSDFLLVRGLYGLRPAFPSSVGAEGVGRVAKMGSKVDEALQGKRVLMLPTYEQGTWADQVVVPVRNIVPMRDDADPLQLAMLGINPATAYLLLNRYVALMPGDWIGQTAANAAMGQYLITLAKLAGVKTLNVVRREEAAEQVRQWGGDRVVLQGDNLHKDIEETLDGKKLSLVLDTVGGTPVGELAKSLKTGGSIRSEEHTSELQSQSNLVC